MSAEEDLVAVDLYTTDDEMEHDDPLHYVFSKGLSMYLSAKKIDSYEFKRKIVDNIETLVDSGYITVNTVAIPLDNSGASYASNTDMVADNLDIAIGQIVYDMFKTEYSPLFSDYESPCEQIFEIVPELKLGGTEEYDAWLDRVKKAIEDASSYVG